MGRLSERTPAEWSDLIRRDPRMAADDIDATTEHDLARGDKLGKITAAPREDAADRLRGGKGTICPAMTARQDVRL